MARWRGLAGTADLGQNDALTPMTMTKWMPCGKLMRCAAATIPALVLAGQPVAAAETSRSKPNILLILADDLGWSDVGCYGGEIRTPHIDALAAGGLRFTQFYNSARCCPTRASLLTGLHPHQAGMGDMASDRRGNRRGFEGYLTDRCVTIPEVLRGAGYRTYMVGKWHLSRLTKPTDRGFDEFYGMLGGFNTFWKEDPHYTRWPEVRPKREYAEGQFYSTDVFADYALDFLADARRTPDQPWFLYLAFNAPHFPLHAPAEEIAKYEKLYAQGWDRIREARHARQQQLGLISRETRLTPRSRIPANRFNEQTGWADKDNPPWDSLEADRRADLARRMAVFAGMVDRMDQAIGRVLASLRTHGELEQTLILFLSDNGACAEWDPWGFDVSSSPRNILHRGDDLKTVGGPESYISYGSAWANAGNTPWRLYKHYDHEGGIATPLIIHWPARVKAKGEFRAQPGHIVDVMATFLEVSGAKYPAEFKGHPILPLAGRSLVPAFDNQSLERDFLAWEHEGNRAIREGRWKLVALEGRAWELYDIEADRTELNNLASRMPEKVADLAAKWEAWAARCFVTSGAGASAPLGGATRFVLAPGDDRSGESAPRIPGRAFTITANLSEPSGDGVIVAQGGDQHGFALYFKEGDLCFSVRRHRRLEVLSASAGAVGRPTNVVASLAADGTARLFADGRALGTGKLGGPVAVMPQDGLQVGHDAQSAAGDYRSPFPFQGRIKSVMLELGQAAGSSSAGD